MTCHQAHNIPWQILADSYGSNDLLNKMNISKREDSSRFQEFVTPRRKKLLHFINCFAKTVEQFATSERKKYSDADLDIPITTPLYGDEEIAKFGEKHLPRGDWQQIQYWIEAQEKGYLKASMTEAPQITKVFIGSGNLIPCLRLAKYGIRFRDFVHLIYGHCGHCGTSRILEDSLRAYLNINFAAIQGTITSTTVAGYHKGLASFIGMEIVHESEGDCQLELFIRPYFDPQTGLIKSLDDANKLVHEAFRMIYSYAMIHCDSTPIHMMMMERFLVEHLTYDFDLGWLIDYDAHYERMTQTPETVINK